MNNTNVIISLNTFRKVSRSRVFPAGSSLYVSCDSGYGHHGKSHNNVTTKCSRGHWEPSAVCLIRKF